MSLHQQALISYLSGFAKPERLDVLQRILDQRTRFLTVVLEDIYYSQNASAVLRTCECLGIQDLHIIENNHDYDLNPAVVRGASKWINVLRYNSKKADNTGTCMEKLKQQGYKIVAMALDQKSIDLENLPIDQKLALCFGTEETGLSKRLIELSDYCVRIPMQGFTQSYNLSVSAGISLYSLAGRIRKSETKWQLAANDRSSLYIKWLVKSIPEGKKLMNRFLQEQDEAVP